MSYLAERLPHRDLLRLDLVTVMICHVGLASHYFFVFLLPNSGQGVLNFSVAVEKCVKKFFRLRFYALEIFTKLGARSFKF